jgi:hypothetical protein
MVLEEFLDLSSDRILNDDDDFYETMLARQRFV